MAWRGLVPPHAGTIDERLEAIFPLTNSRALYPRTTNLCLQMASGLFTSGQGIRHIACTIVGSSRYSSYRM
jgi:hypothetical protein